MKWAALLGLLASIALAWIALANVFVSSAIVFALPWVAAIIWIAWRSGWGLLWSENGSEFPSQSSRLRGFGADR